jgi:hypothetical protein
MLRESRVIPQRIMKNLLPCHVVSCSVLGSITSRCQGHARVSTSSHIIVDVETSSGKGIDFSAIDGQRVPDNDPLSFLNRHLDKYSEGTAPIVMIPASLTVLEVGSIEGDVQQGWLSQSQIFLCAKNSDFVQEPVFKEPVTAETFADRFGRKSDLLLATSWI